MYINKKPTINHDHHDQTTIDWRSHRGFLRAEEAEVLLQADLFMACSKMSDIGMAVHSLALSVQLLRCRPLPHNVYVYAHKGSQMTRTPMFVFFVAGKATLLR